MMWLQLITNQKTKNILGKKNKLDLVPVFLFFKDIFLIINYLKVNFNRNEKI